MIAGGDHGGPGAQEVDADFGGDAPTGGAVLAIYDDEIDAALGFKERKAIDDSSSAGLANDVPKKQQS